MTDIGLSISNFSLKIAHSLITEVNKNVSFSPASIYVALAMLSSGSKEETSKELKELLGEDFSVLTTQKLGGSTVEQSISKVIETLCKSTELKNKIYTQILFAQPYLISTEKVFKTQCEQISFEKPEAATLTMNNWVKENTKGRIDKLIEESLIKPDTGLVLINTIYFKADWETKFDKSETRPAKFTLEDGKKISVQMMYNDGREEIYEEEEKYISLKRKFNNSTIVGLFILPQKGKMLKDFLLSFKVRWF